MNLFLPSEVRANLIGRFAQTRWEASAMTSIAVWTTWLIPRMCRMLMGIPMINLSANAAFSVALIGVDVISLALYLRGTHAGCNHPRPRPLTRLAPSSHSTMVNPSSGYQEWRITQTPSYQAALRRRTSSQSNRRFFGRRLAARATLSASSARYCPSGPVWRAISRHTTEGLRPIK